MTKSGYIYLGGTNTMSRDPLFRPIHAETLVGYALNRLLRGDTPQEAYTSLRRDSQFSHYSTQEISGAVRTAGRLREEAGAFSASSLDRTLAGLFPGRYDEEEIIGYRVVFRRSQRLGHQREPSTVINLPAGTSRRDVVRAARAYLLASTHGRYEQDLTPQALRSGEIYAVIPGGYQRAT